MTTLKSLKNAAKSSMQSKLRGYGASASDAKSGDGCRKAYASGGMVDSGPVEGGPPASGKRPMGAKKAKGGKKGGTNVNVIIMPGGKGGDAPPAGPMAGPPPGPMAGPPPDMGPPPGAGGPPMPMRAHGGKVNRPDGQARLAKIRAIRNGK